MTTTAHDASQRAWEKPRHDARSGVIFPGSCAVRTQRLLVGIFLFTAHHQQGVGRSHDLEILVVVVELPEEELHRVDPSALLVVGADDRPGRVLLVSTAEHLLLRDSVHLSSEAMSMGDNFQRRTGSS